MSIDTDPPPTVDVVSWRERRLEAAGVDALTARLLAEDCGFDLHRLITLIEAGCAPELAIRIIAPLDDRPHPC
jgi:hypothetical protein